MGRLSRFRHIERSRTDDDLPERSPADSETSRFKRVRGPADERPPEIPAPAPARTFERRPAGPAPQAPISPWSQQVDQQAPEFQSTPSREPGFFGTSDSRDGESSVESEAGMVTAGRFGPRVPPPPPETPPELARARAPRPLEMADPETRRMVGEYLAQAVARKTRRGMRANPSRLHGLPLGRKMLRKISNPWVRYLILAVLGAIPLAMMTLGDPGDRSRGLGFPLFLLFMILFGPRRRGWLRTWW